MIDTEKGAAAGKTITIRADVKLPSLPSFLSVDLQVAQAGDPGHPQTLPTIDVADITEAALRDLGRAWTEALVEHAAERRKARVGKPTPR